MHEKDVHAAFEQKKESLTKELAELETKYVELNQCIRQITVALASIEQERNRIFKPESNLVPKQPFLDFRAMGGSMSPPMPTDGPMEQARKEATERLLVQKSLCLTLYQQSPLEPKFITNDLFLVSRLARLPYSVFSIRAFSKIGANCRTNRDGQDPNSRRMPLQRRKDLVAQHQQDTKESDAEMMSLENWLSAIKKANGGRGSEGSQQAETPAVTSPRTLLNICFPLDFDLDQARILASLRESVEPPAQSAADIIAGRYYDSPTRTTPTVTTSEGNRPFSDFGLPNPKFATPGRRVPIRHKHPRIPASRHGQGRCRTRFRQAPV